jgi:signal transduction histidine kinase
LRQHAGLVAARLPGLAVTVDAGQLPPLPAAVEVSAYLIGQEALTNAVRHAGAGRIELRLTADADAVHLEVRDDGRGLPAVRRTGVGLRSMAERVEELGGELVVGPAPGQGTVVRARLPLQAAAAPQPAEPELAGEPR